MHHLLASMVKSNIDSILKFKVTHLFVCMLYRSGIKNVFLLRWPKHLHNREKFCSARNKQREHGSHLPYVFPGGTASWKNWNW